MKTIKSYISNIIDNGISLTHVAFVLVISTLMFVSCGSSHLAERNDISREYIKLLESHIDDDTMLDVIVETDAYQDYYSE